MLAYIDNLTDKDLEVLAGVTVDLTGSDLRVQFSRRPWAIQDMLASTQLLDAIFDPRSAVGHVVSPFLLFSTVVNHAAVELRAAGFVEDWIGPRSRIPLFDVDPLRDFLGDPGRVFFLAKLLTSFVGGEQAHAGMPSCLDLFDLADWLEQAGSTDRVTVLRRMGDIALFLTGVLPDHTGTRPLTPAYLERLARTTDMAAGEVLGLTQSLPYTAGIDALEALGSRWYSLASEEAVLNRVPIAPVVADLSHRFTPARRILNHLSDRYLFHVQPHWAAA